MSIRIGDKVCIANDVVVLEYIPETHTYLLSTEAEANSMSWFRSKQRMLKFAKKDAYILPEKGYDWPASASPFGIPKSLGFDPPHYTTKKDADGIYHKKIGFVKYRVQLGPQFDETGVYTLVPVNDPKKPVLFRQAAPLYPEDSVTDAHIDTHLSGALFNGKVLRIFSLLENKPVYYSSMPPHPHSSMHVAIQISNTSLDWRMPADVLKNIDNG